MNKDQRQDKFIKENPELWESLKNKPKKSWWAKRDHINAPPLNMSETGFVKLYKERGIDWLKMNNPELFKKIEDFI